MSCPWKKFLEIELYSSGPEEEDISLAGLDLPSKTT